MALKRRFREGTDIGRQVVVSAHCAVEETALTGVSSHARESQISVLSSGPGAKLRVNKKIGSKIQMVLVYFIFTISLWHPNSSQCC